jgi:NAD kinase
MYEKIVLVTRKTRLEELVERFNTREQAKFYIEHMGLDFADYDREHATYAAAVARLRRELAGLAKLQVIDRGFLPTFLFTAQDLVVTVGQDGLVVNTAKYLDGQPVVAVNPDPGRFDGILLPFTTTDAQAGVVRVLEERARYHAITMAEVSLNDGQHLLAFNDFLIGQRTHVSARYRLSWGDRSERQSSSGVLVSTGAGSTGWLSSTQHMAAAVSRLLLHEKSPRLPTLRLGWDDPRLAFVVREPFRSRVTGVELTAGLLEPEDELRLESYMPEGGVIFSDGVEADALAFNSGAVATVRAARRQTRLVAGEDRRPRKTRPEKALASLLPEGWKGR